MWSNTIRYLSITSSECELYRVISFFNPEKEKNTKKIRKKKKKIAKLEVKPFNDHQLNWNKLSISPAPEPRGKLANK